MTDMIDKIPLPKVYCDLAIGTGLFEDASSLPPVNTVGTAVHCPSWHFTCRHGFLRLEALSLLLEHTKHISCHSTCLDIFSFVPIFPCFIIISRASIHRLYRRTVLKKPTLEVTGEEKLKTCVRRKKANKRHTARKVCAFPDEENPRKNDSYILIHSCTFLFIDG